MQQLALIDRPRNDYPAQFEQVWQAYPRRGKTKGANDNKIAAHRQFQKRIREGIDPDAILAGVENYAAYCRHHELEGTPFVKQCATFLGPDRHFEIEWEVVRDLKREPWAQVPGDDEALWDWAKEHGYPNPGSMNFYQYRRRLWECVEKRIEEARRHDET